MSKNILLIASARESEEEVQFISTVIRRVMRKFRKPVRCSFLTHIVVGECRHSETARHIVAEEIIRHDAALWNCRSKAELADTELLRHELGIEAELHYIAGRCVVCPCYDSSSEKTASLAAESLALSEKSAAFAVKRAYEKAAKRQKRIAVCTDETAYKTDAMLVRETELAARLMRDMETERFSSDEAIWKHLTVAPFTDVILAGIGCGRTLVLQLGASMRSPGGYVSCEGENMRVYRPELLPFAEYGNGRFARLALAAAAILENEAEAPAAAQWLRRCVGIADVRCAAASADEYRSELLRAVDDRIRNRRS